MCVGIRGCLCVGEGGGESQRVRVTQWQSRLSVDTFVLSDPIGTSVFINKTKRAHNVCCFVHATSGRGRFLADESSLHWVFGSLAIMHPVGGHFLSIDSVPAIADPGVCAVARANSWDRGAPFKISYSVVFQHQPITGRPPLGKILYLPVL